MVIVNRDGRIVAVNALLQQLVKYDEQALLGKEVEILLPERLRSRHREHRRRYDGAPKTCAMGPGLELRGLRRDGSEFPMEMNLSPMRVAGELFVIGIVRDVTEYTLAHDRLRSSLVEKDLLVKETHHRVKNNLQVVSSLLRLQRGSVTGRRARAAFAESLGRVQAIALTHEILLLDGQVSQVDLREYANQLVSEIARIYGVERVSFDVDIAPINVSLETAIAMGLVLHELISNSLKHAFPRMGRGVITIRAAASTARTMELSVADDGVGMPPGFDHTDTPSLGLQIVNSLIAQRHGTLEFAAGNGTTVKVRLPPQG